MERIGGNPKTILLETLEIPKIEQSGIDLEKITYIQRINEISEGFSNDEINFFVDITDLCIDKNDNLFVADSELHKILKFNKNGEFILPFGRGGQGPGEFIGRLRISSGNDGNIYVSDHGNSRICKFSSDGDLIQQYRLPKTTCDDVVANSRSEMYLFSESGFYIIDCYDSSFKYIQSLLDIKYKNDFPVELPSNAIIKALYIRPPRSFEIHKILSKGNDLFLIFNNSLITVGFDQNNKFVNQFRIEHPRFINDYKKRIKDAKKTGGWINCFRSAFLDNDEQLCLCYFNSDDKSPELYRYQQNGKFVDTIRIKVEDIHSNLAFWGCDNEGHFYAIENRTPQILIYGYVKSI